MSSTFTCHTQSAPTVVRNQGICYGQTRLAQPLCTAFFSASNDDERSGLVSHQSSYSVSSSVCFGRKSILGNMLAPFYQGLVKKSKKLEVISEEHANGKSTIKMYFYQAIQILFGKP
jgi:hypothetical protein